MIKLFRKAGSVRVTFALPAEEWAADCSVVGDFNEWVPGLHQLRRRSNGTRIERPSRWPPARESGSDISGTEGHWFNDPEIVEFDGPDSVLVCAD